MELIRLRVMSNFRSLSFGQATVDTKFCSF
jgi:hypothetical protein